MSYAVKKVSDGGEIVIVGNYVYEDKGSVGVKGKTITISGGTLDLSSTTEFNINGSVVLKDIIVKANDNGSIFANGNSFTVEESVAFNGRLGHLYGGSKQVAQKSTHMVIKSGNYREIYGGGLQAGIEGDTYLFVGGNVNKGIDVFANEHKEALDYCIYGGSYSHVVSGNTKVVFDGKDAVAGYVYGSGRGVYAYVKGTSSVEMRNGTVYSIYGGVCEKSEYASRSTSTEVKMYGGKVAQIFGGSGSSNLVGSTHVEIFGGNVTRRIYGGCYNDYSLGWASTENHVVGTTRVILHDEATYGSEESDNAICATSRWKSNLDEEVATLEIETEALYNTLSKRLKVFGTTLSSGVTGYDSLIVAGQPK